MTPLDNIVILTHGWTGSSVFSGLFGQAGYWLGAETVRKVDYETFENAGLVGLKNRLIEALAPSLDHEHRFADADVLGIAERRSSADLAPLQAFVRRCEDHRPWLWKDPRLTWTIRVWADVIDLSRTRFLLLTRDPLQAWASANIRRHVQSMRFTRDYNDGITASNRRFLRDTGRPSLELSFEDLQLAPEKTLERLNGTFGTALTMQDLLAVYRDPLYRKSRNWRDYVHAALIFGKNFRERDGRLRAALTMR